MRPVDLTLPDALPEASILLPGSGHDTDKASATAADAAQVLGGGQLTVGHIDEVRGLEQLTQALMIFRMQPVVGLIAWINLMQQRHGPVGRDGQTENELLEIRAIILVASMGQQLRQAPTGILAGKGHGRGVLMNLRALELENLDGAQGQVKEDILVPAPVEALQGVTDAIVSNAGDLGAIQPQAALIQWREPGGDLVHRLGRGQDIVDQDAKGLLDGQLDPWVLRNSSRACRSTACGFLARVRRHKSPRSRRRSKCLCE